MRGHVGGRRTDRQVGRRRPARQPSTGARGCANARRMSARSASRGRANSMRLGSAIDGSCRPTSRSSRRYISAESRSPPSRRTPRPPSAVRTPTPTGRARREQDSRCAGRVHPHRDDPCGRAAAATAAIRRASRRGACLCVKRWMRASNEPPLRDRARSSSRRASPASGSRRRVRAACWTAAAEQAVAGRVRALMRADDRALAVVQCAKWPRRAMAGRGEGGCEQAAPSTTSARAT